MAAKMGCSKLLEERDLVGGGVQGRACLFVCLFIVSMF